MEHGTGTGTAIVLFTDVVGSTELRTDLGDADADRVLQAHEALVREAIEAYHGHVVKSLGDGVMATFAAASDAVAAAVALCRSVAEHPETAGVQVRVGMSAGDVAYRGEDCHGIPVVEAARLCAAAPAGAVLASDVVRVLAGSRSAHRFDERGTLTLKGLRRPLPTVEVDWHRRTPRPDLRTLPAPVDEATGTRMATAREDAWRDRYRLLQRVGSGGEGEVWRARDLRHDRDVAIKIRSHGGMREIKTLLELRPHPNLPLARDGFALEDGRTVVVMDWVNGDDLGALLAAIGDPGLPGPVVLDSVAAVADALDHMHRSHPPVVHGDVKPENVIRTGDGDAVLVDFGSAAHSGDTSSGGTRGYVAPEVVSGAPEAPSADVYALAATTLALFTGQAPNGAPSQWPHLTPAQAEAIERVLRRGLSSAPTDRPRSAGELATQVRDAYEGTLPEGEVALLALSCGVGDGAWDARPDDTAAVLTRLTREVRSIAASHDGRSVTAPGSGDSELFVFRHIGDAAAATGELHETVARLDRPGVALRMRAGIHTGTVTVAQGLVAGRAVARARGLCMSAPDGGTRISPEAAEAMARESVPPPTGVSLAVHDEGSAPETVPSGDRARRRRRPATLVTVALLVLAAVAAAAWAWDRSHRLGQEDLAQRAAGLADAAVRLRDDRPELAAAAAVEAAAVQAGIGDEAVAESTGTDVRSALFQTVVTPPRQDLHDHAGRRIVAVATSQPQLPFGDNRGRHQMLASLDDGGTLRVWDLGYGSVDPEPVVRFDLAAPAGDAGRDSLTFAPDGSFVAARTGRGVEVVAVSRGETPRSVAILDGAAAPPRFGPAASALAVDAAGRVWDLACADTPAGCGVIPPVWTAPDEGVVVADMGWNLPAGADALVLVDSLKGATVTRREWVLTGGPTGRVATAVREASFDEARCASQSCRLVSSVDSVLVDVTAAARDHVLVLVAYGEDGFVRLPAESRVPHAPMGVYPNPRGAVSRQNESPSDRLVLLSGPASELYTQAADMQQGVGPVDTRTGYATGGAVGLVDATATYVVGGDSSGVLHVNAVTPGQPYVNAGLPEEDPAMPVAGTDLVLRPDGQPAPDCCDLYATTRASDASLALGASRPNQVEGVMCGAARFIAAPGRDSLRVWRFPDPDPVSFPLPAKPEGRSQRPVSLACAGEGSVLVAVAGVGVSRVASGPDGFGVPEALDVPGCCGNGDSAVTFDTGGRVLAVSRGRARDGAEEEATDDLEIWDVLAGHELEAAAAAALPGSGLPIVAPTPTGSGFLVAKGASLFLVSVDADSVDVARLEEADAEAPVVSLSVEPGGTEAAVGTTAAVQILALPSGRYVGEPLGLPGTARHDSDGALWVHPAAHRNSFLFARVDLSTDTLVDRACGIARRNPEPHEWSGVPEHRTAEVCIRSDDSSWRATGT